MKNVVLIGANGKMGQILSAMLLDDGEFQVAAGVDFTPAKHANYYPVYDDANKIEAQADLIIDFSHPEYLDNMLGYALKNKIPAVIATTGYTNEQMTKIKNTANQIPILYAANMSLGINILTHILKQYSRILSENFDIEIIEMHHNKKIDAPSGTALALADTINESLNNGYGYVYGRSGKSLREQKEIGIHSVRGGTIPGEHSVLFSGHDEIIEFKHTALSRDIFAQGAIKAGKFLVKQKSGFYTVENIFK